MRGAAYRFFLRFIAPLILLFPIWERNDFATPPVPLGPYTVIERRVEMRRAADNAPGGITIFEPQEAEGPRPLFVWVLGSNVQPYYQQSLHETLASYGYAVICADTRPLTFIPDPQYHRRNTDLAREALEKALDGSLGVEIDSTKIAAGGYSIGASLSTFLAAESPEVKFLVFWAPSGTPLWFGLRPETLWPLVDQPALYVLGELDTVSPPDGFPVELMMNMPLSNSTVEIIPKAEHTKFQQPITNEPTTSEITREDQQAQAIQITLAFLNDSFGLS